MTRRGSALVISLIVMGILLIMSLGVSGLVISASRSSRQAFDTTRAWYAAESGLERALLAAAENPPGFEEEMSDTLNQNGPRYHYKIAAISTEVPAKNPAQIAFEADRYAPLPLNHSVVVPLFKGSGTQPEEMVRRFHADYYLAPHLRKAGAYLNEDLDILRWKIFGVSARGTMEVINGFQPVKPTRNTAGNPTCVGTSRATPHECFNHAQFYEHRTDGTYENDEYFISTFLESHTQNVLVLTNIMNTDLVVSDTLSEEDKKRLAVIYYHVVEDDGVARLTLPEITITADGTAGDATQSIDLVLRRDTFLPVFNYALYRTAE